MSKDLVKGRFAGGLDPKVRDFTASLELDKRLASHDVRGSIAHAKMLGRQNVISNDEAATLVRELERIGGEIARGTFTWPTDAEDVHSAVERVLTERVGAVGGKLHTGRSRNDQIALDLRLLVVELLDGLDVALRSVARVLVERASDETDTVMPGYTHLQRAQPVSLAHHLLAHVEALRRDRVRVNEARERAAASPLGAGALAGVPYAIDPHAVAKELRLARTFPNSIDAVSDPDFVAGFPYVCALAAVHASRFAEELVLWTSAEFGFAELADQHATGSSIMPQKKNPDVAELVRGRAGRIIGDLVAVLTTLKGLPLAYDGDLQEHRVPLYDAAATAPALCALTLVIGALRFDRRAMERATQRGMLTATDLADHLARAGVPFREAHEIVGKIARERLAAGKDLEGITLDELRTADERACPPPLHARTSPPALPARSCSRGA